MIIKSSTKNYEVKIGTDFEMAKNLALDATCFVVVDSNLYRLYKDDYLVPFQDEQLYVMEAVEEKKTIETSLVFVSYDQYTSKKKCKTDFIWWRNCSGCYRFCCKHIVQRYSLDFLSNNVTGCM